MLTHCSTFLCRQLLTDSPARLWAQYHAEHQVLFIWRISSCRRLFCVRGIHYFQQVMRPMKYAAVFVLLIVFNGSQLSLDCLSISKCGRIYCRFRDSSFCFSVKYRWTSSFCCSWFQTVFSVISPERCTS